MDHQWGVHVTDQMRQYAPYPHELDDLVRRLRTGHPGWRFDLVDEERDPADTHGGSAGGLTFEILVFSPNTYDVKVCEHCHGAIPTRYTRFSFCVPAATYNRDNWLEWLGDCIEATELHEAREYVWIEGDDGERIQVFAPTHGPGQDPYRRRSYASDLDRRTSFRGVVKEER